MSRRLATPLIGLVMVAGLPATTSAGITVYEEGNKRIEIGGRLQVQYANVRVDGGESRDRIFFRRLRPYIQGSVSENWYGKLQFDFGAAIESDEVAVKDAFMRYTGLDAGAFTIGNMKPGFSRQLQTSSTRQQVVERGFVGDHNFGTPARTIGVKWDGHAADKKLTYSIAAGGEHHDPNQDFMDFDSPTVNKDDWNEGLLFVGRIDYHPLGFMKFDRGDFGRSDFKFNVSTAAFNWSNDDDNNTYTDGTGSTTPEGIADGRVDLDSATGFELSAGFRLAGFSADVEYQLISGDTIDPAFTGGIYVNGTTDLDKGSLNAGYMIIDNRLEIAVAYDVFDADGYVDASESITVSLNVFVNKHKAKLQLDYTMNENTLGMTGVDTDTFQAQAQFVF